MFRRILGAALDALRGEAVNAVEYPLELEATLNARHARAPVARHLDILLGDEKVGGESFVDLYERCLADTATPVTPFNVFHRFQSRRDLLKYFYATLDVQGARAECGAWREIGRAHV